MSDFDPYLQWLGLPPGEPPDHYLLLGIKRFETNEAVITAAADQRMKLLARHASGPHAVQAQQLMDEICRASMCLLDPVQRESYNSRLPSRSHRSSGRQIPAPHEVLQKGRNTTSAPVHTPTPTHPPPGRRGPSLFVVWNLSLVGIAALLGGIILMRQVQTAPDESSDLTAGWVDRPSSTDASGSPADELPLSTRPSGSQSIGSHSFDERSRGVNPSSVGQRNITSHPEGASALIPSGPNDPVVSLTVTPETMQEPPTPVNPGGTEDSAVAITNAARSSPSTPEPAPDPGNTPPLLPATSSAATRHTLPKPLVVPFTPEEADSKREAWATLLNLPATWQNTIEMRLVLIPPGEFHLGDVDEDEPNSFGSHSVTITRPFCLGVHEVTQLQWRRVMGNDARPSYFAPTGEGAELIRGIGTNRFPVESISWFDAVLFCNALSQAESLPEFYQIVLSGDSGQEPLWTVTEQGGTGYRLPTEAEWEYACRAGTETRFHSGDILSDTDAVTLTAAMSGRRTQEVGHFNANAFLLHDMHGNVWEWCSDWFDHLGELPEGMLTDPRGPLVSPYSGRVIRGGGFLSEADRCQSTSRAYAIPHEHRRDVGLRVARTLDLP